MKTLDTIFAAAHARAQELELPYAGALLPKEAFAIMQLAPQVKLIDVRSRAELVWVGRIPNALEIEWMTYPGNQPNPDFVAQLKRQIPDPETILLMICRIGTRSSKACALATKEGFTRCYNILQGFEGDLDAQSGQRGRLNGWRQADLPWRS